MWIFGYGSLIWKADFEFEEELVAYIKGYKRLFWQWSTDHRGVVGRPGRVVTLLPSTEYRHSTSTLHSDRTSSSAPTTDNLTISYQDYSVNNDGEEDIVWGKCYKIRAENVAAVREYLDYREKNGYELHGVTLYLGDRDCSNTIDNALVYIGTSSNSEYAGYAPLSTIAHTLLTAHGPSGSNFDYFWNLCQALLRDFPIGALEMDEHLVGLLVACRDLLVGEGASDYGDNQTRLSQINQLMEQLNINS